MILAIDLGNYNIKTSEGFMGLATFKKNNQVNPLNEEIIEIEGTSYLMNKVSQFEYKFNKTEKNYMPNLLYAIVKSTDETEIDLVLNLPLDNLGAADTYKKELTDKTFNFKFNNKDRSIKINKVLVILESVGAYYTLSKEVRESKDIMVIDLGGRTTNVITFHKNKVNDKKTLNIGMIEFYDKVREKHNFKGNNLKTEQIKDFIEKDLVEIDHADEVEIVEYIFNEIEGFANVDFYEIYVSGGGAITLQDTFKEVYQKCKFINEPLFANVNGNVIIAKSQFSKK